jgi:hypothetical protein
VGIDAVVECRDSGTDYQSFTQDGECQWEVSSREIGVGVLLEVDEKSVQYERDVCDVGIQPAVSVFKIDEEHKIDVKLVRLI